jgi:hypothetical protein
MKDLVSVEEANGAESLLQQLMFHPVPLHCVFNLCYRCILLFILLMIIELTHRKNRRAIKKGR